MSQLALAHERQLIGKGCSLRLTVDQTPKHPATPSGSTPSTPSIKLQMVEKGQHKDKLVDIVLDKSSNAFLS